MTTFVSVSQEYNTESTTSERAVYDLQVFVPGLAGCLCVCEFKGLLEVRIVYGLKR